MSAAFTYSLVTSAAAIVGMIALIALKPANTEQCLGLRLSTNNCREYCFRTFAWIREHCFRIVWLNKYGFRMAAVATALYQDFEGRTA